MSTRKHKIQIKDAYGDVLYTAYVLDKEKGLAGAELHGFIAPGAKLPAVNFRGAILYWASLSHADLSFCDFVEADLRGANLDWSTLRYADLRRAIMAENSLGSAASICGADLTGANLEGARLRGVKYSDDTIFPVGFDPGKEGMILLER